ncbi:MAG: PTS glucose transporter subunit IIA [Streptococcaceae bacterium]|jgi:PTS system beta-glucosides-specific IIA component|nr:PTS glucose transporter subunit IIA [Streptococcaceae bacterium]
MLDIANNKEEIKSDEMLYAPFSGRVFKIEETTDTVFSQKLMGEGFAIDPTEGKIFAPVSGKITLLNGHAIGFAREDGLEILLHIGIDTVSLNGDPYHYTVEVDDNVEGACEIGSVDLSAIEAAGLSKTSMVIFTNTKEKLKDFSVDYGEVTAGGIIGRASSK